MTASNKYIKNFAQTLTLTQGYLTALATSENFWDVLKTSFGIQYNTDKTKILLKQWQTQDFSSFPTIEVISSSVLGGANAAYAASKKTIYISDAFLVTASSGSLVSALLEEYGHYIDNYINDTDSPGDEGAIFSSLVLGETLSDETLQILKAEDNSRTINLNGEIIQLELQNFIGTSGNDTIIGGAGDDNIQEIVAIIT